MAAALEIIGGLLILAGAFFFVVGAIGIYRMPDVFTRMHAAGISDTVGAGLLLIGMMFLASSGFEDGFYFVVAKLGIILATIVFTSPIATHALAQAALHEGLEPEGVGKKVLIGPGAHPGPETIGKPSQKPKPKTVKKSAGKTTRSSARPKSVKRTTSRRAAAAKGRARS